MSKKYWQLTLLALYACGFSYGENNLGAARTMISREANVPLTALAGGGALNYLLLVSVLFKSVRDKAVLIDMTTGLCQYLLDPACNENRPSARATHHHFVRSRYAAQIHNQIWYLRPCADSCSSLRRFNGMAGCVQWRSRMVPVLRPERSRY